ncbi:MAG: OmpA family protein [Rhodospirillales bacterium]
MKILKMATVMTAALLLGACGMLADGSSRKDLAKLKPSGTTFNSYLAAEYLELSTYEEKVEYDWQDSEKWADKGLAAAANKAVLPEDPKSKTWDGLPSAAVGPLSAARQRLMAALDKSGRDKAPKAAARAQVMYDCWVEEEEEAWQKARIAYCKGEFEKALAVVERALGPAPPPARAPAPTAAPAPAPMAPANFIVYFDFDSDKLNPAGMKVVDDAAAEFKKRGRASITLAGHTDKSGSSAYNQRLSKRRADAVLSALVARGVPASVVTEQAFGEDRPAVPTADGVKEARNRRVEINNP